MLSTFLSASGSENEASLLRVIIVGIICLSSRFISGVPELLPFLGDKVSVGFVSLVITGDLEADLLPLVIILSAMFLESVASALSSFVTSCSSVFLDSILLSACFFVSD